MLIIAQPKSASTSLAVTLSELLNWPYHQMFLTKNKSRKALGLKKLGRKRERVVFDLPHGDMCEYSLADLQAMSDFEKVFKQHIPPTENNLNHIKNHQIKCVVLLRDPKDSAEAYCRHVRIGKKEKYKNPRNNSDAINKRFGSLHWFYKRYINLKDLDHIKIIHFEDLVINPTGIINEILVFYNKDSVDSIELKKERYTGEGLQKLKQKDE